MNSSPSIHPLPPGFRFHPSDQELITHYLKTRVTSSPLPASVIAEVDLYQFDPWELPKKALFGEDEWYFFTPRERKYPNGARPNRAAASGYWKATGIDKPIFTSCGAKNIGVKKALVFYSGRPPRGVKTEWIMHEYRLIDAATTWKQKGSMRLDDWVLCRVRKKSSTIRTKWGAQSPSHSPEGGYFQKAKGYWSLQKEPKTEPFFKDYINSCPLLPYLLNSPELQLVGPYSSTGSANTVQASFTTSPTINPSNIEEVEFSKSSLENLFELFRESSDETHDLTGTELGSEISFDQGKSRSSELSPSVSVDCSNAEIFQSPENPYYTKKDDEYMNPRAHDIGVSFTGAEGSRLFQNFGADQWNPIFQT